MKNGTYYLKETVSPKGYNILTIKDIEVKLGLDDDNADIGKSDATTVIKVPNYAGTALLSTGSVGIKIFIGIGSVLLVVSALLIVTNKRIEKIKIMQKRHIKILLIITFIFGLLLLFYPLISQSHNERFIKEAILSYDTKKDSILDREKEKILADAEKYNKELAEKNLKFIKSTNIEGYEDLINIDGIGTISYISIPKININLPIKHGTDDSVLTSAVGHLEGSSLPVGGKATHSVLSAHRGFSTSRLFTDLVKLEIGDIFTIVVLDRNLTYEVDQIKIVEPDDTRDLQIEKDKDYVTLVTCTLYGSNTHRLLVRGHRIEDIVQKRILVLRQYS